MNLLQFWNWKAFVLLGLVLGVGFMILDWTAGAPLRPAPAFFLSYSCALLWLLVAPLILRIGSRFPLRGDRLLRNTALHILGCYVFAIALTIAFWPAVHYGMRIFFSPELSWRGTLTAAANYFFLGQAMYYWLVVSVQHAFQLSHRLRDQELRATRAEELLTRSRLDVLRMQMSPHFLFNTLNSVSALVSSNEPQRANDVVARLGDSLRAALEEQEEAFAPIGVELTHLENYVEIERCRFGERLRFEVQIDESLMDRLVPRWILQPIVENAVIHGLQADINAGHIRLSIQETGEQLEILVEDDGPGPAQSVDEGIGLGNTRERLKELFGERAELTLLPGSAGGTRLQLLLPAHIQEPPRS